MTFQELFECAKHELASCNQPHPRSSAMNIMASQGLGTTSLVNAVLHSLWPRYLAGATQAMFGCFAVSWTRDDLGRFDTRLFDGGTEACE